MRRTRSSGWAYLFVLVAASLVLPPTATAQTRGAAEALLVALAAAPSGAQSCPLARGCTQTLEMTAPFATRAQSLWGPHGDQSLLENVTLTLFDARWDEEGSEVNKQTFGGGTWWGPWTFGGSIDGSSSGRAAAFLDITEFGKATVDIDYPVHVVIRLPEPNTFRAGEPVTIRTSWEPVEDDVHLLTRMGATDLTLRGVFGMRATAGFSICLVSCESLSFFPDMTISEAGFPIFQTVDGSFGIGDQEPTDPAAVVDFLASSATGIDAFLTTPDPLDDFELEGTLLEAQGSDEWVVLDIDWDQFLKFIGKVPGPPLGACVNLEEKYNAFDLCYETIDLDYQFRVIQDDAVSFRGSTRVRVDFPSPLGYEVLAPDGTVSESGSAATVSFPVGHDLVVHTPPSVEPSELASTFSLENTLSRQTELRFPSGYTYRALQLSFDMASVSNSRSRRVDQGSYQKKSCPSLTDDPVGNAACEIEHAWEAAKRAASKWWRWVEDWVTQTVTRTADAASFDLGPLFEVDFAEIEADVQIFDRDWALAGFSDVAGPALLLDPENPIIAVTTSLVNTSWTTGANHGTVTQTLVVENQGDVPLNAASVLDAVSATGIAAELIESVEITVNGAFDGTGDPETLDAGQTLPVGGAATVTVRWTAVPGVHSADIHAEGTSPIGTLVHDDAAAAFAWLDMAIGEPGDGPVTINRRSRGVTPIHLLGSAALSVSEVDRTSLTVEGVAPARINAGDANGDGIEDLTLLVPTQELLEALDARIAGYQSVVVATADASASDDAATLPSLDVVAAGLLDATISDREAAAIDRAGNRNGRLDVGDLRAAVLAASAAVAVVAAAPAKSRKGGNPGGKPGVNEGEDDGPPNAELLVLVLAGTLNDGTTLWAEDAARIIGEAR